jgi:hypothetical protein
MQTRENIGLVSGPIFFITILFFPFPQDVSSNDTNPDSENLYFKFLSPNCSGDNGVDGRMVDNRMCAIRIYKPVGAFYFHS